MKKFLFVFLLVVLFVFVFTGCSLTLKSQDGGLGYFPDEQGVPTHEIKVSEPFIYIIHPDFLALSEPYLEVDKLLRSQFRHDTRFVKGLTLSFEQDILDFVIMFVTGGVVGRQTVVLQGTAYTK